MICWKKLGKLPYRISHSLNLADWTLVMFLKCDTMTWISCIRFQSSFWQEYVTGEIVYFLWHHTRRHIMSNCFSKIFFHLKTHFLQLWDIFVNSFFEDVFPTSHYFLCLHFLELPIIHISELLEWLSNITVFSPSPFMFRVCVCVCVWVSFLNIIFPPVFSQSSV